MERNIRTNGTVNLVALLLAAVVVFASARYCGTLVGQVAVAFFVTGLLVALASRFQMRLEESERLEQLELEELARKSAESALFKTAEAELYPARRAREQFEKFLAPLIAVLLLALQAGGAWWLWGWLGRQEVGALNRPAVSLAIFGAGALILFLLGKVSAGISRLGRHRLLRPGAGYLLLGAYLCAAVAAALAFAIGGYPKVDLYLARALLLLLGLVAAENLITLILEIYRPRIKGAERRLLYESRLVGLVSQPEGLFTTAAHALDYQFGFKVSETWFYQFLQKYLGYFVLAQLALLLLSSCFVIIEPGEQAILERFGRPTSSLLNPGAHLKWPWPVDQVYRHRTDQVQTFMIGHAAEAEEKDEHGGGTHADESVELWSVGHFKEEYSLLVADREAPERTTEAEQAVPVNLLAINVPVQYQVTNLLLWATNFANGGELLERSATREVVRYLVNVDLNEILTSGREKAANDLRRMIQQRADELNLGVRILFVGLQNIHPPVRIAPAYQAVVAALQEKEAKILEAEGYAARALPAAQAEATLRQRTAEINAIRTASDAQAQAVLFTNRLVAFRASPTVFTARAYLQALVRGSADARKYILGVTNTDDVILLNLEDKLRPGIDDVPVPPSKTK